MTALKYYLFDSSFDTLLRDLRVLVLVRVGADSTARRMERGELCHKKMAGLSSGLRAV